MHGTASDRVVEQKNASNHVPLHHSTGDAAVGDEMLDGLLFAFGRHILDDLQSFVGYLGKKFVIELFRFLLYC